MSVTTRLLGAVSAAVVSVPFAAATAHADTIPAPPTKPLPAGLDIAPPYIGQTLCDPTPKPGAVAFAELMTKHYGTGPDYGISRACTFGVTEHSEGRAVDWMLNVNDPHEKAIADAVTQWLSAPDAQGRPGAMARRFGIMYMIWNNRMWRAYDPARGWAPYSGVSPHTDHIHFSFTWDGAYARTSWWTGVPLMTYATGPGGWVGPTDTTTTPPTSTDDGLMQYVDQVLRRGSSGPAVTALQTALGGLVADGEFGPATESRVREYQASKHITPADGVVTSTTWRALAGESWSDVGKADTSVEPSTQPPSISTFRKDASAMTPPPAMPTHEDIRKAAAAPSGSRLAPATVDVRTRTAATVSTSTAYTPYLTTILDTGARGEAVKTLQRGLGGMTVDGVYGSRTAMAVTAFQQAHDLEVTGRTDRATWEALQARDYPLLAYRSSVLRQGSTGLAVKALQVALRIPADGEFGAGTRTAVLAAQQRAGLARTGTVASLTWQAIEKQYVGRTY